MSPWRQSFDVCIVGIPRTHFPLRRLALALSVQLVILGVTGNFAQAEDPPPGPIVSACRVDAPPAARGKGWKLPAASRKVAAVMRVAGSFMLAGAYDRAIEQFSQVIDLDVLEEEVLALFVVAVGTTIVIAALLSPVNPIPSLTVKNSSICCPVRASAFCIRICIRPFLHAYSSIIVFRITLHWK